MSDDPIPASQARAHLRPLPRCRVCERPAVEALYNGRNDYMGVYCHRHARAALKRYKLEGRLT